MWEPKGVQRKPNGTLWNPPLGLTPKRRTLDGMKRAMRIRKGPDENPKKAPWNRGEPTNTDPRWPPICQRTSTCPFQPIVRLRQTYQTNAYVTWERLVCKIALHGNLTINWPTAETAGTFRETCGPAIILPQCIVFWDTISTHGINAHPRPPANALVRALSTRWSTRCQRVSERVGKRVRNALRTRYGCTK